MGKKYHDHLSQYKATIFIIVANSAKFIISNIVIKDGNHRHHKAINVQVAYSENMGRIKFKVDKRQP